jgi:hypothetical protein
MAALAQQTNRIFALTYPKRLINRMKPVATVHPCPDSPPLPASDVQGCQKKLLAGRDEWMKKIRKLTEDTKALRGEFRDVIISLLLFLWL